MKGLFLAFALALISFASPAAAQEETPPAAIVVATVAIEDPAKFREYAAQAQATLREYGGAPVVGGRLAKTLAGDADHGLISVIRFASVERALAWYRSEAYQDLVPLRQQAGTVTLRIYAVPNS